MEKTTTSDINCSKTDEDYSSAQYRHILNVSQINIENELRREDSLLVQASHMQTAFAFITAAIFAALPVCINNRGTLSYMFFYVWISIIMAFMLASLCLASVAQWRFKTNAPGDIDSIRNSVLNDEQWTEYTKESYRDAQIVDMLISLYSEKNKLNEIRVKLILSSMVCFFLAVAVMVICYIHATCLLWF